MIGRIADRYGRDGADPRRPGRGSRRWERVLPWAHERFVLAVLIVCAELAFGTLFTPAMTLLTHVSEEVGLDYGYTFALISLAWAPGQAIGAAGGGALAHATSDAVPYIGLSLACLVTFAVLRPRRPSTVSVARP